MKFTRQNTNSKTSNLYATQVATQTSVLRGRYSGKGASSNPNNVLSSRKLTGNLLIRFPESAVLTIDPTSTSPSLRVTTDGKQSGILQGPRPAGNQGEERQVSNSGTSAGAYRTIRLAFGQSPVARLTNVLSRTPLISQEAAIALAGGDARAYLEAQGVKNWKQSESAMADGTRVDVFTATDNPDANSKTKQPKRTYIFAFGKDDKILRRAYSEVVQADGSVKVRDEVHTNINFKPDLSRVQFHPTVPAGTPVYKPPIPPLVSSMPEDAPTVPKELLQHNTRYPNGIRFDPSRSLAGGGGQVPASAGGNEQNGFALGAAPTFSNANAGGGGNNPNEPSSGNPNRRAANAPVLEPIGKGSPLKVEAKEGIVALEASVGLFTFGTTHVLEKPVIEATFTLKNTSTKPLTIEKIAGSCECITAEFVGKSKTLAPDATADVKVLLDTALTKPGLVQKTVLVHTKENPDGASARLQIQGRLTPLVTFQPFQLSFGNIPTGEARKPQIIVATFAPELVKALKERTISAPPLIADDPNIRVRPSMSQLGLKPDQIRYDVQVAPNAPNGTLLTTVSFGSASSTRRVLFLPASTNPADSPLTGFQSSIPVVVSATIQGNIASEPRLLAFGPVERKDSKTRTRTVVIAAPDTILKTIRFTCDNPKVTIKPLSPLSSDAKTITLEVTLPANLQEGLLQAKLLAISTEKGEKGKPDKTETLAIPISAFFKKE
jgi:Protein of unknown function (DUF1573)